MAGTREKKRKRTIARHQRLPRGPQGGIELLLIQTVEHLGKQGDVVEVKPGYANNYLIPQGLATVATDHHKRMVEKHKQRLAAMEQARLSSLHSLKDKIVDQSVTIAANANEETGHLYGSITATDICEAIGKLGIELRHDQVRLTGPLKEVGMYSVKIHLGHEVEADLRVWVVPTVADGEEAPAK